MFFRGMQSSRGTGQRDVQQQGTVPENAKGIGIPEKDRITTHRYRGVQGVRVVRKASWKSCSLRMVRSAQVEGGGRSCGSGNRRHRGSSCQAEWKKPNEKTCVECQGHKPRRVMAVSRAQSILRDECVLVFYPVPGHTGA